MTTPNTGIGAITTTTFRTMRAKQHRASLNVW